MQGLENCPITILVTDIVSLVHSPTLEFATWRTSGEVIIFLNANIEHSAEVGNLTPITSLVLDGTLLSRMSLVPAAALPACPQAVPFHLQGGLCLHTLTALTTVDRTRRTRIKMKH